jgi:GntR family transcriptional repressor for pyruvate dehydrogenase complex
MAKPDPGLTRPGGGVDEPTAFKTNPPLFRAIEQTSVVEALRMQLLSLIREGKLKPGTKLPPEKELMVHFGVSRPALREALHTLVGLGLLDVRRGQGTYVREPSSSAAIRSDVVSLLLLSEDLKELQDIRRILEPELAVRVVQRATEEELDELEAVLDGMDEAVNCGQSIYESAWAFHRGLAQAAGNSAMAKILDILYEMLRAAQAPIYEHHFDPRQDIQAHRQLLDKFRKRDPALARAAMLQHITMVENGLNRALGEVDLSDVDS